MRVLKRIISSALVFTVMASFTVFGTKATSANGFTDFITSDTDIDAILKTPYTDAVPTAFSELILGTKTSGFGFAKDTLLRTGEATKYDMQVGVKVNGDNIAAPEGYYYPSHTALSGGAKRADDIKNLAPLSTVSATYSYSTYLPSFLVDGLKDYDNTAPNRWATWKSPNNADTLTFAFDKAYSISSIDVHFFTDGGGTQFPKNVVINYWNGTEYVEVPNVIYPAIVNGGATVYNFDEVTTDKITITCTRATSNKGMGITEVEIFGKAGVSRRENIATTAAVSASYSYSYSAGSYRPDYTIDGKKVYSGSTVTNRWANWKSGNATDWLEYDFGRDQSPDTVILHFFTDGGGTLVPSAVSFEYWNGTEYVAVQDVSGPDTLSATEGNTFTFPAVKTSKLRVLLTNANYSGNKYTAVTETEIYADVSGYYNVARTATVCSSVVPKYNSVDDINDGIIAFYAADDNRWNTYTGSGVTKTSTVDFDFASVSTVDKIAVYPYDEITPYGSKTEAAAAMFVPENITFQYAKDGEWVDIPSVTASGAIEQGKATIYTFPAIETKQVRATVTAYDGKTTGITELEIYGSAGATADGPYDVEVSEDKFITTDHVVTSVVTVKNIGDKPTEVAFTTKNSRGVFSETKDGYTVVMSANGATKLSSILSKTVTLAPGESTEYISTLSFAKTEAEATANAAAVTADENRLQNHKASYLAWFKENVPFFECDDPQITQTYYFRWLTYRNNIRLLSTDKYMISEFMPNVSWAGAYNSIVAALPHHIYEGRWIKNTQYLDDYKDFWFETDGTNVTGYVNSTADAYYADYLVSGDDTAILKHLDNLIAVYNKWETQTASDNAYYDEATGLYFVKNGYDGMEYSLSYKTGGTDVGYRPTVNAYMYGDAMAIAEVATLAGKTDVADEYLAKAEKIKNAINEKLWNSEDKMYEAYDLSESDTVGVKELIGYVPWYYNMPADSEEFASAWAYLTDENTFYAPYGSTTADKSHSEYNTYYTDTTLNRSGNCNWDGSSWPFATTQTLVAAANALNNYENAGLTAHDYYKTLKAYTNGQYKNGYSWVGENLDGDTGKWYIDHAHRSYHYNHSAYADLIITGLVGIRPADNDDTVVINPLVPEDTLSSFVLENVSYRGNNLTVVYDKMGETYGVGKGLKVYVNGELTNSSDDISEQTVILATHEHDIVHVEAQAPGYTSAGWNEYEYCTVCDYTTYSEIDKLEIPALTCENDIVTLSGDKVRRVYWGYIGTENITYKWFNDFMAQCGDTFTAEYAPKAGDKYVMSNVGYYRFVVTYIDDDGSTKEFVYTFESEGNSDIKVPTVTVNGNYAVANGQIKKLYYGYIGTEKTPYLSFDPNVLTEADFDVKTGESYVMTKAGYYRFVVVYQLDGKIKEVVYTLKNEKDGGQPTVTHADGKITLSTGGVTVNKMYIAYNGADAVEINNWTDYCDKAIARACYQTPEDSSEYTLKNTGCYTILVNYWNGTKNVDAYFTFNN